MKDNLRIIISGGGTGGHIFPAVSIANAIKEQHPDTEILFVGAEGRMEMQRVPAAGYKIIGLPVAGFDRKNLLKNVSVLVKLLRSQLKARQIIKEFKPHAAVGVGGYASGPTLKMAGMMGIPTLIQEQNSYAGVTNKLLAKKACKICVAYEGMERFFDKEKIILTGNPVRQGLLNHTISREEAIRSFGLDPQKKTILIIGGSLGARTINNCVMQGLEKIKIQVYSLSGRRVNSISMKQKLVWLRLGTSLCYIPPTLFLIWLLHIVLPIWLSAVPELDPSQNSVCCKSQLFWYPLRMLRKTIRQKMHWL